MPTEVRIPTTGNAGEDAVIVEWKFAVGDAVAIGDTLLVIETAKSTVDVESTASGTLLSKSADEGDEIAEFAVVALIGDASELTADGAAPAPPVETPAEAPHSSAESTEAARTAVQQPATRAKGKRTAVSPRARRLAAERGVDTETVAGSGPLGRVTVADVLAAASGTPVTTEPVTGQPVATPAPATPVGTVRGSRVVPVRGARKVTAQRMQESLASTAQVTLTRYAGADRLLDWIARLKEVAASRDDAVKIGLNDAVHFAVTRTLGRHPQANSWFTWEGITQFDAVHLGFAVDTGSALLVPVIQDADLLSIGELAKAARAAIERARAGHLTTDEMAGGTFTVSNLGGAGVHWFTPVLNPPQSCILGIGALHRVIPEAPALLPLSLTFDHRALDGSAAAALLADLAHSIENVDVLDAF